MVNDELEILKKHVCNLDSLYNKYKKKNKVDEVELYENICNILSWFEICDKRLYNLYSKHNKKKISAFRYANNMKKHSTSMFKYEIITHYIYPSPNRFPSISLYPSKFDIYWNELPLDNDDFLNQFNNYNNFLKGKNLLDTINEMVKIMENTI